MSIADAVDRLRQPEYTGADRCMPCTVVNLLLAVLVAGVLAAFVPWVAVPLFVVFLGAIYLRGYLVPGTPELTKRYLPPRVLRLFGKQPIEASFEGETSSAESRTTTETTDDGSLTAAGVVSRTETDIDLTPAFREEYRERIQLTRERTPGEDDVRALVDADTVSRRGDQSFVVDGNRSIRWESAAAFVADVAAASILEERFDGWDSFEWDRKRSVLLGLRLCLERCPSCGGPAETTEDRVDPCCQKAHLTAQSVCEECGVPLADAAVVDHGDGESVRQRLLQ